MQFVQSFEKLKMLSHQKLTVNDKIYYELLSKQLSYWILWWECFSGMSEDDTMEQRTVGGAQSGRLPHTLQREWVSPGAWQTPESWSVWGSDTWWSRRLEEGLQCSHVSCEVNMINNNSSSENILISERPRTSELQQMKSEEKQECKI